MLLLIILTKSNFDYLVVVVVDLDVLPERIVEAKQPPLDVAPDHADTAAAVDIHVIDESAVAHSLLVILTSDLCDACPRART